MIWLVHVLRTNSSKVAFETGPFLLETVLKLPGQYVGKGSFLSESVK